MLLALKFCERFYSESGLAWTNSTLFKNLGVRPAGDFAITGHEAAHAYTARHFGDNTAYLEGADDA